MRIKIKLVGLVNRKKWKNKYVILKDLPASFHLLFVYHLSVVFYDSSVHFCPSGQDLLGLNHS